MDVRPALPDAAARLTRAITLFGTLGLIVLGLGWELWWAPTGSGTLAVKVLPLALAIAGVLKYRMQTYRWLSLGIWFYFTEGVVRAWSDRGVSAMLAGIEVALSLLVFVACALHVRLRLRPRTATLETRA